MKKFKIPVKEVVRVIDGDTVEMICKLPFRVLYQDAFRLARIDCDERHTEKGKDAKYFLQGLLSEAVKQKSQIYIISEKHGAYRWLAEIIIKKKDIEINVNDFLVEKGHATYREKK